jgi:RNA polymerase sigma-70 factor (ECF subfamily)
LEGVSLDASHEELVRRAAGGDEDALVTLLDGLSVQLHGEIDRRIGSKYRGLVEADDILQITCLEAFLRVSSFVGTPEGFLAWLRRIAENNLRDAIKELERDRRPPPGKRVHQPSGEESYVALVERIHATTTTASRVYARHELRQNLDAVLKQLPPDYEQVLRLYELEGLSGAEVAERMGRKHGAVRMLLARARERLTELLVSDTRFFSRA